MPSLEPLRAEPNGFLVHLLSHSDTVSCTTRITYPQNKFCVPPFALLLFLVSHSPCCCVSLAIFHLVNAALPYSRSDTRCVIVCLPPFLSCLLSLDFGLFTFVCTLMRCTFYVLGGRILVRPRAFFPKMDDNLLFSFRCACHYLVGWVTAFLDPVWGISVKLGRSSF